MHQKTIPNNVWYLWLDDASSCWMNMAKDEVLLQNSQSSNSPLLRFYSWDASAISIGYFQNHSEVRNSDCNFVRRPTGGGIVYHGSDITYTVVCSSSCWLYSMSRCDSYRLLHTAIMTGLQAININSRLSQHHSNQNVVNPAKMRCFDKPTRNDVIAGKGKIAGGAQKRNSYGMLHQGSIQLPDRVKCGRKHVVSAIIDGFQQEFCCSMKSFQPSSIFTHQVIELAKSKYSTGKWNKKR